MMLSMRNICMLFILIGSVALSYSANANSLKVNSLECMHLKMPVGIDSKTPALSWKIESDQQDIKQVADQVIVASSREKLSKNAGDIWDSKKTESRNSIQVQYGGTSLETAKKYFWKVRIWDNHGKVSAWSEPSFWIMGILNPEQWKAQWITYDFAQSASMPLFRKEFLVKKKVKQAIICISGLGYSETYLNGTKLGNSVLDPAQTNYESYCLYVSYDVSKSLREGENRLGVMLGDGWYNENKAFGVDFSYGKPKLICHLKLDYTDGTGETIVSDGSWEWTEGPVLSANVYAGENYDARKEVPDWSKPGSKAGTWHNAVSAVSNPPSLRAQMFPPIQKMKELPAVNFHKTGDGKYVFDFGQNFAGWVRIKVNETSGTTVKLRTAEELFVDGTINPKSTGVEATQFVQTETYICKGKGTEIWEPRFTYHGFRYVEVSGLTHAPDTGTVKGIVVYSSVPVAGTFKCSNENINRLHEMALWTETSNLHGIPTDCPAREKCGWLGDAHAVAPMTIYNFGMETFWIKYLADIRSSAAREGNTIFQKAKNQVFYNAYKQPGIPYMIAPGKRECGAASADWGTALVQIPWYLYLYYGNAEILREYYPDMKFWTTYLEKLAVDNLVLEGLGDWCPPGGEFSDCPFELSSTAYYYLDLSIMENSALIFHNNEDAGHYKTIREAVKKAFNARFYDAANHTYGSQTGNVIALDMGLVPAGDESEVSNSIVKDMDQHHNGFMHTGIFGLSRISDALSKNGNEKVAYRMLGSGGKESFENMWKIYNATTLWEVLPVADVPDSIKLRYNNFSHNHPMQGGFDAWLYKGIAGISPVTENPGFSTILFEPLLVNQLDWAEVNYESGFGIIKSAWKWKGGTLIWDITIPCNTNGEVQIPFEKYSSLKINGKNANDYKSLVSKTSTNDKGLIQLNSGKYHIELAR